MPIIPQGPKPAGARTGPPAAKPAAPPAPPNNLVGLGLLAVFVLTGAALQLTPQGRTPLTFAFVLVGWILAVMAHEYAHAWVAFHGGDRTVKAKGYLSFDPRRYGDLQTSLILPMLALMLGGIGFPGGAVYLRQDLMRGPFWRAASSLAGPAATLIVLLAIALPLGVWSRMTFTSPLFEALTMLGFLQAMALILNLLPFPGLDGFNAVRPFLPRSWGPMIRKAEGPAMLILLALLLLVPGFGGTLFAAAADVAGALGLPRDAMAGGWAAFHFWKA